MPFTCGRLTPEGAPDRDGVHGTACGGVIAFLRVFLSPPSAQAHWIPILVGGRADVILRLSSGCSAVEREADARGPSITRRLPDAPASSPQAKPPGGRALLSSCVRDEPQLVVAISARGPRHELRDFGLWHSRPALAGLCHLTPVIGGSASGRPSGGIFSAAIGGDTTGGRSSNDQRRVIFFYLHRRHGVRRRAATSSVRVPAMAMAGLAIVTAASSPRAYCRPRS